MIRSTMIVSAAALVLTLGAGCDRAADDQAKANNAQAEANKKIAEADKESTTKTTGAQVEADKKIASAEQDFAKRREDYRHSVTSDLVDVDKKIDTATAKDKTLAGKKKMDMDANLASLRAQRTAFDQDLAALDKSTALQFDSLKEKTDKDLSNLKSLVDKAD